MLPSVYGFVMGSGMPSQLIISGSEAHRRRNASCACALTSARNLRRRLNLIRSRRHFGFSSASRVSLSSEDSPPRPRRRSFGRVMRYGRMSRPASRLRTVSTPGDDDGADQLEQGAKECLGHCSHDPPAVVAEEFGRERIAEQLVPGAHSRAHEGRPP
jgi:hypothetical protein